KSVTAASAATNDSFMSAHPSHVLPPILRRIFTPARHKCKPGTSGNGRSAFFGATHQGNAVKVQPDIGVVVPPIRVTHRHDDDIGTTAPTGGTLVMINCDLTASARRRIGPLTLAALAIAALPLYAAAQDSGQRPPAFTEAQVERG